MRPWRAGLAGLEQALRTKLFERRPTGYVLTAVGRQALEPASVMEDAAGTLGRVRSESSLTGLIRITATPSLAEMFLTPRLMALHKLYPALDFEVIAERGRVSLPRHQSDIALRLGRPERGDILARRLARVGYGFYCVREWRDRLKEGILPVFIGFDEAGISFPKPYGWHASFVASGLPFVPTTRPVKSRQRAPDSALLCCRISSRLENPPWSKCDCLKFRPHANCGY